MRETATDQQDRVVHPTAKIGEGTQLGSFSVVSEGVTIGRDCQIGSHVVIHPGTIVGDGVRIDDHAVLGKLPMKAAASRLTKLKALPPLELGDECLVGTGAVIYRGTKLGQGVLVADHATVREDVEIGDFTIVGRGVAIENRCRVGSRAKLETNVYLTALSEVGDGCFISPCVATSNDNYMGRDPERFKHYGGVKVRTGGRIGVNATVLPGKVIGEDALVAAGALVTRDVPARKVSMGVPARPVRDVPERQLLKNQ